MFIYFYAIINYFWWEITFFKRPSLRENSLCEAFQDRSYINQFWFYILLLVILKYSWSKWIIRYLIALTRHAFGISLRLPLPQHVIISQSCYLLKSLTLHCNFIIELTRFTTTGSANLSNYHIRTEYRQFRRLTLLENNNHHSWILSSYWSAHTNSLCQYTNVSIFNSSVITSLIYRTIRRFNAVYYVVLILALQHQPIEWHLRLSGVILKRLYTL